MFAYVRISKDYFEVCSEQRDVLKHDNIHKSVANNLYEMWIIYQIICGLPIKVMIRPAGTRCADDSVLSYDAVS